MATPVIITDLELTNSTTYADVAGLDISLDRIHGETSDVYIERLKSSAVEERSHLYEGLVNEIAFSLGLGVRPGIRITGPDDTVLTCDLSGITLVSGAHTSTFPLAVVGIDDVLDWNSLSGTVAAINATNIWQGSLLAQDGPAIQLCRQDNTTVGMPYDCVVSDVGLIGLSEPSITSLAITSSGGLSYQLREFIQNIMLVDRSYWAR